MTTPQRDLLLALERRDIIEVRRAVSRIPKLKEKAVLLAPRYGCTLASIY